LIGSRSDARHLLRTEPVDAVSVHAHDDLLCDPIHEVRPPPRRSPKCRLWGAAVMPGRRGRPVVAGVIGRKKFIYDRGAGIDGRQRSGVPWRCGASSAEGLRLPTRRSNGRLLRSRSDAIGPSQPIFALGPDVSFRCCGRLLHPGTGRSGSGRAAEFAASVDNDPSADMLHHYKFARQQR
jgi:hypothetical protein